MTRQDDTGAGPCVNERADIGNQAGAAAVVSIHGDGSTRGDARGFHVAYSDPPLNTAQGEPSHSLATTLRDALAEQNFPTANYIGTNGLFPRDDLAGMNLSQRPAVLVECGNMRGPEEAALMSSSNGRQRYATGIANGVLRYLARSGVM
jgi:N-acetylmuramoyl-L-alanine amidase